MKILWQTLAIEDLQSIQQYIAQDSPQSAALVVSAIFTYTESALTQHAEVGRIGRVAGTRELVVPRLPYVVPYRIKKDQIEVLAVHHTSRRWPDSF